MRPPARQNVVRFDPTGGQRSGGGGRSSRRQGRGRKRRISTKTASIAAAGLILLAVGIGAYWSVGTSRPDGSGPGDFTCSAVSVTDGDTFRCDGRRVRMEGIDAPELPGHCSEGRDCVAGDPFASTSNLRRLIGAAEVVCRTTDTDRYGRTVARCFAGEKDLSCEQVRGGFAEYRYALTNC